MGNIFYLYDITNFIVNLVRLALINNVAHIVIDFLSIYYKIFKKMR